MDELTTSSVDGLLEKIRLLASRPISEFNRFEALNMLEARRMQLRMPNMRRRDTISIPSKLCARKLPCQTTSFVISCSPYWGIKIKNEFWMLSPRSKRTIAEIQSGRISERQEEPCQPLIIGLFVVIIVIVLGTLNCIVYNGKWKWGL